MKKNVLYFILIVFIFAVYVNASHSARPPAPGEIPDVTGYYEGSITRFFPTTLKVENQQARFYIWAQEGKHFWGSVNADPGDGTGWKCSGYINGLIQPDNSMCFVNYNADYSSTASPPYTVSQATAIFYAKFSTDSRTGQKKIETEAIRPVLGGNVTSTGTYTSVSSGLMVPDICDHP